MDANNNSKFAIALLDMINKKKEEIRALTNEILQLEDDPKNIKKIRQNVLSILNAVTFCSDSKSNNLDLVKLKAGLVLDVLRMVFNQW